MRSYPFSIPKNSLKLIRSKWSAASPCALLSKILTKSLIRVATRALKQLKRERESVCVYVRESERERVCVYVRESERMREREGERGREREREKSNTCSHPLPYPQTKRCFGSKSKTNETHLASLISSSVSKGSDTSSNPSVRIVL